MTENTVEEWQFIIPLTKEDLLKSTPGQYTVNEIIDLKNCWNNLSVVKKDITNKGCCCILQHFDILYSIFCEKDIDFVQLQEVYDTVISRMMRDLGNFVREAIKEDSPDYKLEAVNVIKMNFYVFSLFEKTYEGKLSFNSENFISEPKRGKGAKSKSKTVKPEDLWDWNSMKKLVFTQIYDVIQEKLDTLWPSHIVEESLINLIANCCYKALENPDIVQSKLKSLRDSVSQVLAVLVASYNHGLTFIPKIVQLMKEFEHVAPAISNTAMIMMTEYNSPTIVPKLLKELNGMLQEEDIPGLAKSVAVFITDIVEAEPELLLPSIKILSRNLVVEPYAVRNATLLAFCDLILKCFTNGNISDEEKQTRDKLLKHLHNHLRDQNSYVRSKVLQLWCKLASNHAIPKDYFMPVLQTAKNRISDKSCMAVKSAIQLFTVILKENPYAGKLDIADMRGKLLQAKTVLKNINAKRSLSREEAWVHLEVNLLLEINKYISTSENGSEDELVTTQSVCIADVLLILINLLHQKHYAEAITLLVQSEQHYPDAQEIRCNMDKDSDPVEYYRAVFKKIFTRIPDSCDNLPVEFDSHKEEYNKQKAIVDYVEESLTFTLLMNDVGKEVNNILKSKSVMGVSEAIEFFTVAYQFGVADSKSIMRNILLLIRCDQPAIKDAVAAAYKKLYLTTCQKTAKARAAQIAQRLTKLLKDLDLEQKCALQDLIDFWVQNNELEKEFIQVLWDKFVKKNEQVTDEECGAALILLDMMACKTPTLASSNTQIIIDAGFNDNTSLLVVEYSCLILTKLSKLKENGKSVRLPQDHELFVKIVHLLVIHFDKVQIKGYKSMALAAINMISKICCYPEKVMDALMKELYEKLMGSCKDHITDSNKNVEEDSDLFASQESLLMSIKELLLERILLIHSEILFRKWRYLSHDVINNLSKNKNIEVPNGNDNEMDEFEAENRDAEDDALMNSVNELCEQLIMDNDTIDAYIRDLTVKVCTDNSDQYSISLKGVAAISLAKYMMVSQGYCEEKIQLFITLMEKSRQEIVRSNLVLAIGDLIMRHPNIIEPWTPRLFTRLGDASMLVRKNAVLVICHLITREMLKVRGHVAELCLCLEDSEPSIAEQVRSLFIDLSKKGNTLYNIIPDIISRLSNPERSEEITVDIFERIMKFTLGLIGKERQNELLVEKLCVRLHESNNQRQWKDLSFCLLQLNFNEKSLRKLIDALPQLNERLLCPEVHNTVITILNNAQKSAKQNFKDIANEGLVKVEEILTCKDKDGNTINEAAANKEIPSSPEDLLIAPKNTRARSKIKSSAKKQKRPR